jgi:hypothetical protein
VNWLNPVAFAGLVLLTVPVLVHLFARRNARVLRFPTLRFIENARAVAPRRARLADIGLLVLRLAVIGVAVAALAQPLWTTDTRRAAADGVLSRVVIVDTSVSVSRPTPTGESGVLIARREAARLAEESRVSLVVETDRPSAELRGAADWLAESGIGRREAVIVSDFQRGAVASADIGTLPADIGVRLLRVDVSGDPQVSAQPFPSVAVLAPESERALAEATLRAVIGDRVSGIADQASRAILVDFTRLADGNAVAPDRSWMGDVLWALRHDSARALRRGDTLVLQPAALPGTLDAALLIQRAAHATAGAATFAEHDTALIAESVLRAWERPASVAVAGDVERSDGRWLWMAVLLLLAAEHFARRLRGSRGSLRIGADAFGE